MVIVRGLTIPTALGCIWFDLYSRLAVCFDQSLNVPAGTCVTDSFDTALHGVDEVRPVFVDIDSVTSLVQPGVMTPAQRNEIG